MALTYDEVFVEGEDDTQGLDQWEATTREESMTSAVLTERQLANCFTGGEGGSGSAKSVI